MEVPDDKVPTGKPGRFQRLPHSNPQLLEKVDMQPETLGGVLTSIEKVDDSIRNSELIIRNAREEITQTEKLLAQLRPLKQALTRIYDTQFAEQAEAESQRLGPDLQFLLGFNLDFFQPERIKVLGPEELGRYDGWRLEAVLNEVRRVYGSKYEFPDEDYTRNILELARIFEERSDKTKALAFPIDLFPKELQNKSCSFIFIDPEVEYGPFPGREKEDPKYMDPLHKVSGPYESLGWYNEYRFTVNKNLRPQTFHPELHRIVLLKKK